MEIITSRKNPYIKELLLIKRAKGDKSLALIEGMKLIFEAKRSGVEILSLLVSDTFSQDISDICTSVTRVISVNDSIIEMLSSTSSPQGVIALIERRDIMDISNAPMHSRGAYMILERVSDPGNVGTIIRTAEAFSAAGVVICKGCADLYNEKTLRATMGSAFRANIIYAEDAKTAAARFKSEGIAVFAATLDETSVPLGKRALPDTAAFIIGNEAAGVSRESIEAADASLMIPMSGRTESLNAAVAASVIMWEMAKE